ncbi:MAG: amino acid ABC transporter permease [Gammaproteobacteria bacterium]|nr:amino acid ABC transporter permease [Gammaproteobacteria bacterium]
MQLDYTIFIEYLPAILEGFKLTLWIVLAATLIGLPLGLVLALARSAPNTVLRVTATAFVELFRNTPFMIQVFLLYYVLPFHGVRLHATTVGILALALFSSVYYAEIFRAGIKALPRGQAESGRAIGMSAYQSMRHVVLPQALPIMLPPLCNQTLSLVKESAILSTITVQEMTMSALRVQAETFRPFEVFIMIALLYWLLNETIAFGVRRLERSVRARRSGSATRINGVVDEPGPAVANINEQVMR